MLYVPIDLLFINIIVFLYYYFILFLLIITIWLVIGLFVILYVRIIRVIGDGWLEIEG